MFDNDNLARASRPGSFGLGPVIHKTPNVLKAVYDFSKLGGAIGDIALNDDLGNPAVLPKGAIVKRSYAYVITAVTSAGSATVALKAASSADLMAATAKASLTVTTLVEGACDGTVAKMVGPLAADKQVKVTVAAAALTAGKIQYYIEYVIS